MLETGIKGEQKTEVVYENTATAVGSGVLEVFATPCMIALMEKTACDSVLPYLNEGDGTCLLYTSCVTSACFEYVLMCSFLKKLFSCCL